MAERIRVSIQEDPKRQIQGAVTEFALNERFNTEDLEVSYFNGNNNGHNFVSKVLKNMSCLKIVGRNSDRSIIWRRTFDPRNQAAPLPDPCRDCYFNQDKKGGCVILEAHGKMMMTNGLQEEAHKRAV